MNMENFVEINYVVRLEVVSAEKGCLVSSGFVQNCLDLVGLADGVAIFAANHGSCNVTKSCPNMDEAIVWLHKAKERLEQAGCLVKRTTREYQQP